MKHNLFSRFIGVLLAVVMLASLMSMPSLANTVSGEDLAVTDVQTTDTVDGTGEETTDEAGSDPAALSVEGEEDKTTAGEENGEPDAEEGAASENEAASSSEEGTVSEENTASSDVDTSSAEETAPAAVQLTAEAKNEAGAVVANVTVEADEGVIPEGAALVADLLTGNDAEAAGNDLDEAGVEYDGYMALDIHLEDADGNEVEPNGEVRVIMVAPAALPEDADPTTVAVQHHEEQDNGEVKVEEVASAANTDATPATLSADTASSEQPATGVAAENTDVTAAFGVEKFSTFTITWGTPEDGEKVTVYYVDTNGSQILNPRNDVLATDTDVDLRDYANSITGYNYEYAVVNNGPAEIDDEDYITADQIRYQDGKWKYGVEGYYGGVTWYNWELPTGLEERRVFLVYSVRSYVQAQKVDTVDTDESIQVNLFNYDKDSINSGHTLKFDDVTVSNYIHPNFWTSSNSGGISGEGGVLQGIVQKVLPEDRYPVLQANTDWDRDPRNESFGDNKYYRDYTWNPQNESLAYLFDPDTTASGVTERIEGANYLFQKNADGYYYYDSDVNAAVVDNQGTFTVYSKPNDAGFNPFGASWSSDLDPFFGMTVETQFFKPEDGKVNGQDMVFEFSGDDDVWVYVDDVLLLDMGGIHGEVTGSINFATQRVTIDMVNNGRKSQSSSRTYTFEELFRGTGKTWNNTDYYAHSLKFFYLERGANVSNCKIRFNLPVIPNASLVVSKDLAETGSEALQSYLEDTMTYRFRVLDESGNSYFDDGKSFNIMKDGQKVGVGTVENGMFTLKAGQSAVFPDAFGENAPKYYVEELLPQNASGQYEGIQYTYTGSSGSVTITGNNGVVVGGDTYTGYKTNVIDPHPGQTATVSYTNTVNTENMATLQITKELQEGDTGNSEDVFQMQVKVNGELIAKETTYTVGSETKTVTTEGIIELKAGETATIPMLADSSYEVQEVNLNTDLYKLVSYQKNTEEPVTAVETAISGTIAAPEQEEQITVTNGVNEPDDDKDFDGKPDYQKKAVDDDGDGVYDLSLSVKGSATPSTSGKQPINVLFIFDMSDSMNWGFEGRTDKSQPTRLDATKEAVSGLVSKLSEQNGYDARFAVVSFNWDAKYIQSWTTGPSLNYGSVYNYTNYEDGVVKAKTALAGLSNVEGIDRSGYPTVVVFLSDGEPNRINATGSSSSATDSADAPEAMQKAIDELKTMTGIEYFYTVGVGKEYETLSQLGTAFAGTSVATKHLDGREPTDLADAFETIAEEVTYKAFSNVTINDTLSDYVDVQTDKDDNPTSFYIEAIPSSGTTTNKSKEVTKNQDGTYTATLNLKETKMNAAATLTATYDPTAKTVVLDFPNDYKLENQWTYEVHINILPNDDAETAYINAGYEYPTSEIEDSDLKPNAPAGKADEGTGTHEKDTGFYSNKAATITYTAEGNRYIGNYKNPVVQLKTAEVTIVKNFVELDTNQVPGGFVINVNNGKKVLDKDSAVKANGDKTWSWTLNLPYGEYSLTENNYTVASIIQKHLASVSVDGTGVTVPSNQSDPVNLGSFKIENTDDKTITVTNTYREANGNLSITKKLNSFNKSMGSDATFQFKITNTETGMVWYRYVTFDQQGEKTVKLTNIPAGNYTIEELPSLGYSPVSGEDYSEQAIVTGGSDATVMFTNKSTGGNIPGDQDIVRNNFAYKDGQWQYTQDNN